MEGVESEEALHAMGCVNTHPTSTSPRPAAPARRAGPRLPPPSACAAAAGCSTAPRHPCRPLVRAAGSTGCCQRSAADRVWDKGGVGPPAGGTLAHSAGWPFCALGSPHLLGMRPGTLQQGYTHERGGSTHDGPAALLGLLPCGAAQATPARRPTGWLAGCSTHLGRFGRRQARPTRRRPDGHSPLPSRRSPSPLPTPHSPLAVAPTATYATSP